MTIPADTKPYPPYFFMWTKGTPYITTICGWTAAGARYDAENRAGMDWKHIYNRGGRVVKCTVRISKRVNTKE